MIAETGDVLITGASGFVGTELVRFVASSGLSVRALSRRERPELPSGKEISWYRLTGFDYTPLVEGCSAVVHLAAKVHVMREHQIDSLEEYRRVNVVATESLARLAVAAGVRRFVFVSSVKVNGEETELGRPFRADDVPAPEDAYAISKHEAELALHRVAEETGLEVVIIRPPLVYGPGVKGNFLTMLNWLQRGVPLPLASLDNRRSLVGIDNLCDLILTCLSHPRAANEIFLVSDGRDLSTPELLRLAGEAIGHPARLFEFPSSCLHGVATIIGQAGIAKRLCGNLQVDIGKTQSLLGWTPRYSIETGLRRIAIMRGQE